MKKEDIYSIFEENPELAKIGTKTQYYQYIKGIFPESKVKEIVYHGTGKKFDEEKFDKSKLGTSTKNITNKLGFYFVQDKRVSDIFIRGRKFSMKSGKLETIYPDSAKTYSVILNIKNPEIIEGDLFKKYAEENKKLPPLKLNGDSVIISPQTDNILTEFSVNNYIVFEPDQIHILGSKKDIQGFKEYVNKKNVKKSLEKKVVSITLVLIFISSIFFISSNITGNVTGNMTEAGSSLLGIVLFLLSISVFFMYRKLRS